MLSRTASSLYWLGRYFERADFIARLVEATVRLDVLSARPAGQAAWASALAVTDTTQAFATGGRELRRREVARFLTVETSHPGSIVRCVEMARLNARAVRTALTREAWTAINQAWLTFAAKPSADDPTAVLALTDAVKHETRGFEGAVHRMLRNQTTWFIRLGQAVERADNTARLLDVKYHLLLPEGEPVGGVVDRDQWTGILRTVSAVTAYRWLYRDGLKPWLVAEFLILRDELPRSLMNSVERIVTLLNRIGQRTGRQGEADRLARRCRQEMRGTSSEALFQGGLHEYLGRFIADIGALDRAISQQFRFT